MKLYCFICAPLIFTLSGCRDSNSIPRGNPPEAGARHQAHQDCLMLERALKGFHNEYFRYPLTSQTEGPHELVEGNTILATLRGRDTREPPPLNHRDIAFIEFSSLATSKNDYGFHKDSGRFNDPWGQPYSFYVDRDDKGHVSIPKAYGFPTTPGNLREGKTIFVQSGGPDKDLTTIHDNVTSWD